MATAIGERGRSAVHHGESAVEHLPSVDPRSGVATAQPSGGGRPGRSAARGRARWSWTSLATYGSLWGAWLRGASGMPDAASRAGGLAGLSPLVDAFVAVPSCARHDQLVGHVRQGGLGRAEALSSRFDAALFEGLPLADLRPAHDPERFGESGEEMFRQVSGLTEQIDQGIRALACAGLTGDDPEAALQATQSAWRRLAVYQGDAWYLHARKNETRADEATGVYGCDAASCAASASRVALLPLAAPRPLPSAQVHGVGADVAAAARSVSRFVQAPTLQAYLGALDALSPLQGLLDPSPPQHHRLAESLAHAVQSVDPEPMLGHLRWDRAAEYAFDHDNEHPWAQIQAARRATVFLVSTQRAAAQACASPEALVADRCGGAQAAHSQATDDFRSAFVGLRRAEGRFWTHLRHRWYHYDRNHDLPRLKLDTMGADPTFTSMGQVGLLQARTFEMPPDASLPAGAQSFLRGASADAAILLDLLHVVRRYPATRESLATLLDLRDLGAEHSLGADLRTAADIADEAHARAWLVTADPWRRLFYESDLAGAIGAGYVDFRAWESAAKRPIRGRAAVEAAAARLGGLGLPEVDVPLPGESLLQIDDGAAYRWPPLVTLLAEGLGRPAALDYLVREHDAANAAVALTALRLHSGEPYPHAYSLLLGPKTPLPDDPGDFGLDVGRDWRGRPERKTSPLNLRDALDCIWPDVARRFGFDAARQHWYSVDDAGRRTYQRAPYGLFSPALAHSRANETLRTFVVERLRKIVADQRVC